MTIPAHTASVAIDVAILDNLILEDAETVTVTPSSSFIGDDDISISLSTAVVTINDNDTATASVTASIPAATEASTDGQFTVALTRKSDSATTIAYTIVGDATSGLDYIALSGTVTIPADELSKTIDVTMLEDAVLENQENVTIQLTNVTSGDEDISVDSSPATVTISDNDSAEVSIVATQSAIEGTSNGTFTVSLSQLSDTATKVSYTVGGNAIAGTDYAALSGTVTILANQPSATINVAVLDEDLLELTESVVVTLTEVTEGDENISLDAVDFAATVEIEDTDVAQLSVTASINAASEPGTDGQFTVALDDPSDQATTINYTLTGNAVAASDFSPLAGSVTIGAGALTATIPLAILDDDVLEASETVVLTLAPAISAGNAGVTVATQNAATVTIADEDTANAIVTATTDTADEAGADGQFTITLTHASDTETRIAYTQAGDAVAGEDYEAVDGFVVIAAGSTSATVDIVAINDATVESSELVTLQLTSITSGDDNITVNTSPATITINDNDEAVVSITDTTAANEAGTSGVFTVSLSQPSDTNTVVSFTASGDATTGSDYTTLPTSVTIVAGETEATINVNVVDDDVLEDNEQVSITLGGVTQGDPQITLDNDNKQASLTIVDDDDATLTVAATNPVTAAEGGVNGQFTITLSNPSDSATVVRYDVTGDATSGADYTALPASVTLPAGELSAVINVAVLNDATVEDNELVILTLNPTTTTGDEDITVDGLNPAVVTIADDDMADVSIAATTATAAEPGSPGGSASSGRFTVSLDHPSDTDTTINYTVGGTATPTSGFARRRQAA